MVIVYAGIVMSFEAVILGVREFDGDSMFSSAASLFLESIPQCILYSVLWARPVLGWALSRRAGVSLG